MTENNLLELSVPAVISARESKDEIDINEKNL